MVFIIQINSSSNKNEFQWWMCVYSQITKGQFTAKKGKETYWDLLHSALWFSLDFCNNSEMKPGLSIMISGLRFFSNFFLQKIYSLIFYSLKKKKLKTLGQYWGAAQPAPWLFNSLREMVGRVFWEITSRNIHPCWESSGNLVQMRAN